METASLSNHRERDTQSRERPMGACSGRGYQEEEEEVMDCLKGERLLGERELCKRDVKKSKMLSREIPEAQNGENGHGSISKT